jgi:APA family basic amino acid/polyamine antiporter
VFTTLVLMTGITAAVPYAFSALVQAIWRIKDGHVTSTWVLARDLFATVVAFGLSLAFIYYSRNNGNAWYVYWGPFLMTAGAFVLGIPVYLAQRKHMTEPADVPPYK